MDPQKVFLTLQGFKIFAKTWKESLKFVYCFSIEPIPLDNKVY